MRVKQEAVKGVLDPEGQKPTWIYEIVLKTD